MSEQKSIGKPVVLDRPILLENLKLVWSYVGKASRAKNLAELSDAELAFMLEAARSRMFLERKLAYAEPDVEYVDTRGPGWWCTLRRFGRIIGLILSNIFDGPYRQAVGYTIAVFLMLLGTAL